MAISRNLLLNATPEAKNIFYNNLKNDTYFFKNKIYYNVEIKNTHLYTLYSRITLANRKSQMDNPAILSADLKASLERERESVNTLVGQGVALYNHIRNLKLRNEDLCKVITNLTADVRNMNSDLLSKCSTILSLSLSLSRNIKQNVCMRESVKEYKSTILSLNLQIESMKEVEQEREGRNIKQSVCMRESVREYESTILSLNLQIESMKEVEQERERRNIKQSVCMSESVEEYEST